MPNSPPSSRKGPPHSALHLPFVICFILLLAFFLRVFNLTTVPPGWRDDEVIETTVHAQIVLDGHYPLYFIQAEGHEPIYHYLSAGWIALVGRTLFSVRLVSVFFGLLTVAATFRLTRQLFGTRPALLVALLLAVSFWALMYSRIKIRHFAELPFVLLAFSSLFKVISYQSSVIRRRSIDHWSLFTGHSSFFIVSPAPLRYGAVLFIVLALYTYLAATTLFIILTGFSLYLLITALPTLTGNVSNVTQSVSEVKNLLLCLRDSSAHATRTRLRMTVPNPVASRRALIINNRSHPTRYIFLILALTLLLYLPLANAIRANATRLAVVGGPLTELRNGNWQPLLNNTLGTLAMFGNTGDNEALYNLPGRPIFNIIGFYFFLTGLLIAATHWRDPRYGFLLIWLIGGLAPGFASNPPASLGHTLTALPAVYILAALPLSYLTQLRITHSALRFTLTALLVIGLALRDLPDYFLRWPTHPAVQYLYKANLHALATQLRGAPPATYVLSGPLSKWDRVAFTLEGLGLESPPRWVNADWAIIFPSLQSQSPRYLFTQSDWQIDSPPQQTVSIHFSNDLIFEGWTQQGRDVLTHWRVGPAYTAPEPDPGPSVATPPSPSFIFLHLLDSQGNPVSGSDRFDVDAYSLQPGDQFLQRHTFDAPPGSYTLEIGLYNPSTGERYLTLDNRDSVQLGAVALP